MMEILLIFLSMIIAIFHLNIKNIIGRTGNDGIKTTEVWVPLKFLCNSWRTLEISLISCKNNLILTWYLDCIFISGDIDNQVATFTITDSKLYVPVIDLSTQENEKRLDQLKSYFKWTIDWNKYQSKVSIQEQNQYLYCLIDPSFHGVNRLFILSFKNNAHRTSYNRYLFTTVEIKDSNAMINGKIFFEQPVKNDIRKYIW